MAAGKIETGYPSLACLAKTVTVLNPYPSNTSRLTFVLTDIRAIVERYQPGNPAQAITYHHLLNLKFSV